MSDIHADCTPSQPLSWETFDIMTLDMDEITFLDGSEGENTNTDGLFQLDVIQPSLSPGLSRQCTCYQSPRSPFVPLKSGSFGSIDKLRGCCSSNSLGLDSPGSFQPSKLKFIRSLESLGSFETLNAENICSNVSDTIADASAVTLSGKQIVTEEVNKEGPHQQPAYSKCKPNFIQQNDSLSSLFQFENRSLDFELEDPKDVPNSNFFGIFTCTPDRPKRVFKSNSSSEFKLKKQNSCPQPNATSQYRNKKRRSLNIDAPQRPAKRKSSRSNCFSNVCHDIVENGHINKTTLPNLKWEGRTFSCEDLEEQISLYSDGWSLAKVRRCRTMLRLYRKRQHGKYGISNRPRYTSRQVFANARRRTAGGKFAKTK